jgi:predicted metal-dependent peptidase
MKLDVRDRLTKARVKMLLKHPFWGNLATRMKIVEAGDWCKTAATDGRHFYYCEEFINSLDDDELVFLFGHEVGHCVYNHMGRRGERDPQLWNMAGDYLINDMLITNNVGKKITKVPILWDPKFRDMTAEEVYDDLFKNAVKIQVTLDMHMDGSGEEGEDDADGDGKKKGKGSDGKSGSSGIKIDDETMKKIKDEVKEAVLQSAQAAGAGNTPVGIKRLIQQFTAPKMRWQDLLQIQLESSLKNNYSFTRPSRKGWHTGAVLPGMLPAEHLDVAIAIDMSGSISAEMAQDFLSEVKGMMDMYTTYSIHVFCFDTEVYNPVTFTDDSGEDIHEYEPQGGGGTDFDCAFRYMKDNDINPKQFVMFTDGYPFGSWGDENYCDSIFIVHGNDQIEAPFGVTAHYELDKATT